MELATALEELNKAKAMIEIVTDDRNQYADRYNQANAENTRLQRALDAEREKVAFLEKKNANLIEASNLVLKVKAEQDAQLATLQAQLAAAQNEIDTATDQIPARMDGDSLSVALIKLKDSERDITNQMVTLQAQLRQVDGQSKTQAEEAVIVFAKYTTLRQLVEALPHTDLCAVHQDLLDGGPGDCNCFKSRATLLSAAGKQMEVK